MELRFLGACSEVGRSGLALRAEGKCVLMDYGVLLDDEIGFPAHIPAREVDAILITHAHLDHSGLVPLFYLRDGIPVHAVEPTFKFSDLLIKDFLHLSGYYLPYEYVDLKSMMDHAVRHRYSETFEVNGIRVTFLNAGHIPGSCQALIEAEGKRLLYTGDFNTTPSRLLNGAEYGDLDLDAIVIESTYANEDHPDRWALEREFVSKCREVVERGGTVLIPAFGVGRSQEVLSILEANNFEYPVYVDGMALDAIELLAEHPESLRDFELFDRAIKNARWINDWRDRRIAVKTPSVIVSPAGMLKGGAAVFYMESISQNERNAIYLVSFQIPGTPGRTLLDERKFVIRGRERKVLAEVDKFVFSSHCGRSELESVLSKLDGRAKVFVVHGAEGNCERLAGWASEELGLEAHAPRPGDIYKLG
ncbi:MAG: MBL fold metallo-hydrolase [Candidatus Bathyarchaeia archaeon]